MFLHPTLCLHVPVSVCADGRTFSGDLYLPKAAQALRLCILQGQSRVAAQRLGALLANGETATLTLNTDEPLTAAEATGIIEWIRTRRLLQRLAIKVIAPSHFFKALRAQSAHTQNTALDAADRFRAEDTSSSDGICRPQRAAASGAVRRRRAPALVPA